MKTNKKVVILILGSTNSDYEDLTQTIKDTWFNIKNEDVEILFYTDNSKQEVKVDYPILNGSELILPCADGYHNIGIKTLMAFEWVLTNYNPDYIFRCNLGSFVDSNKIMQFLQDKPTYQFYCGIVGEAFNLIKFASGSGYFLSNDLIKLIVDNNHLWAHSLCDDVAVGYLLNQFNICPNMLAKRLSYCNEEIYYQIGANTVNDIPNNQLYHIRCRSNDRKNDIAKINNLYAQILLDNNLI